MADDTALVAQGESTRPEPAKKAPLVFLSHDTSDADIAEAFSKLLSSVSAGVLKSFRSSDRVGNQGIEYGVEWYPEIMRNLHEATDVVCLLTEHSIGRPWILFEAGVAKGRLNTPILGVAVGVALNQANTGPFAQFQNSDDDEDSLTKLVRQLVEKIPNSEPDDEIIRDQVVKFRDTVDEILKKRATDELEPVQVEPPSANADAKLFEEVKVMFMDLSSRINRVSRPERSDGNRLPHPEMLYRMRQCTESPTVAFRMALSLLRNLYPWVYEAGIDALERIQRARTSDSADEACRVFVRAVDVALESGVSFEPFSEREAHYAREYAEILYTMLRDVVERKAHR